MGSDITAPSSMFLSFSSGQSQYDQNTSCVTLFIINDTVLEDAETLAFQFILMPEVRYVLFRTNVNITIYEDPSDGEFFCIINVKVHSLILACLFFQWLSSVL